MKKIVLFLGFALFILGTSFVFNNRNQDDDKGLTVAKFNEKISNEEKIVVAYFKADWCVPCIKLKPIIEELQAEQKDRAAIIKIDVDENPELSTHFEINTLPLFHIYRHGKLVWQYTGLLSKKEITDKIELYKY